MKAQRLITATALAAAGALSLAACGSDNNKTASPNTSGSPSASSSVACATGTLHGAGSTFQANIVSQWSKDFQAACAGATVDYQAVGSGAGIAQFGADTIDFGGSDSTMKPEEQTLADKRCGGAPAIHLPLTAGGLSLAYNLKGVTNLQLSPATVAGIFQGTIKSWDDAAIAADNPGVTLPKTAVQGDHRSDASGSTKIFSAWLDATSGGAWKLGVNKELAWPSGTQGFKGSDGVTQDVVATEGAITYVELSFAKANNLSYAKVKNGAGEYAELGSTTVSKALESATLPAAGNDLKMKFDYTTKTAGVYPVTGFTYEIVCSTGNKAATLPLLKAFLTYAVTTGQASADSLGYGPLPTSVATRVQAAITALA